jgi:hypothetical protein
MINHRLLRSEGILILTPEAPLESADFERIAQEVDPYIKERGKLSGLLVHAKTFPGWANLEALVAHVRFVEGHHRNIQRLAVVSDSELAQELPRVIGHLVHPEIKQFSESRYDDALRWLQGASSE